MSARLRVEELRAALLSRGLDVTGTKNALVSPPAFPQDVRSLPQQSPSCYSRPIFAAVCAAQRREWAPASCARAAQACCACSRFLLRARIDAFEILVVTAVMSSAPDAEAGRRNLQG